MATHRELAHQLENELHADGDMGIKLRELAVDIIERHIKYAIAEECKRWTCICPKKESAAQRNEREHVKGGEIVDKHERCVCQRISKEVIAYDPRCPVHGMPSNAPTAADALKAVRSLSEIVCSMIPAKNLAETLSILNGCEDILNGNRNTDAAQSIIRECK
jgi:hypothetical protein